MPNVTTHSTRKLRELRRGVATGTPPVGIQLALIAIIAGTERRDMPASALDRERMQLMS